MRITAKEAKRMSNGQAQLQSYLDELELTFLCAWIAKIALTGKTTFMATEVSPNSKSWLELNNFEVTKDGKGFAISWKNAST